MKTWIILAVIFIAFAAVMNFIFEGLHLSLIEVVKPFVAQPGIVAAGLILLLLASDIFLPIPSTVVMVLSGVLFGTVGGGLLSFVGSLLGNWAGFELMYRFGPPMCKRYVDESKLRKMQPVLERFGAVAVVISRPVPIMMETLSFLAGLARMPRASFLLASVVGTVPIAFLYAYAGASAMEMKSVVPAIFMLVCLPAVGWLVAQRRLVLKEAQRSNQ